MNRATMFEELETTNNIRYYENEGDDEKVDPNDSIRGGSIEKLVQRLTHDELALNNFTRCFLLLYPSFCTSRQLLELLIIRFPSPFPSLFFLLLATSFSFPHSNPLSHFFLHIFRKIFFFLFSNILMRHSTDALGNFKKI